MFNFETDFLIEIYSQISIASEKDLLIVDTIVAQFLVYSRLSFGKCRSVAGHSSEPIAQ